MTVSLLIKLRRPCVVGTRRQSPGLWTTAFFSTCALSLVTKNRILSEQFFPYPPPKSPQPQPVHGKIDRNPSKNQEFGDFFLARRAAYQRIIVLASSLA